LSDIKVKMVDLNQDINDDRFSMYETTFEEVGTRIIGVGDDKEIVISMMFEDNKLEPTYQGGEYTGLLKLGRASVYFSWTVKVERDNRKMKEIEAEERETKKAEEKAEKAAKKAEEKATKAAEKEAEKLAAEEKVTKDAEEKAKQEAAAAAKAEKEATIAEKKAEKEAKRKAGEEAAAATALLAEEE